MQKDRLTPYAYLAIATISIGAFLYGFHLAVVSGVLCCLAKVFNLSFFQEGFIVSVLLLGACVGTFVSGTLADRFGRKKMLIFTAFLLILATWHTASAQTVTQIVWGRFFAGIGIGFLSVLIPLYLSEMAPPSRRGSIVATFSLGVVSGIFLAYLINYHYGKTEDWRAMFAFGIIPASLLMLLMFFLPDTPEWLFAHKGEESAIAVLKKFRKDLDWKAHLEEMRTSASPRKDFSWHAFLKPLAKRALVIGIILNIFQQITGINGIIYFSPRIFQSAGFDIDKTALLATLGVGAINILGTFLYFKLIDRAGRKPLLQTSLNGMFISLIVLALALYMESSFIGLICLISILGYVAFFAIGIGSGTSLITAEIFPLSIRGKGMSIAVLFNWIANFCIAQTFLILMQWLGAEGVFFLFAGLCLVASLFVYKYIPETKGKSLEEIEAALAHPSRRKS